MAAVRVEVAIEHFLRDTWNWKSLHRSPNVTSGISVLKAPDEHRVHSRSRDDAELPSARDGICESPVRDGDAHAALDDLREPIERWHGYGELVEAGE
jgi:hypothetical protein